MHRFKLEKGVLELYFHLTQKNLSIKERDKLLGCLNFCNQAFEGFICGGKKTSFEFSLTICGKMKITSLNQKYRNQDKPTDVLSFPLHENLKNGVKEDWQRLYLGDIYICREIALMQAEKFHISYYEELVHLFVHGFLHLLGYDHEISKREEQEMLKKENDLLNNITGSKEWKNLLK